jgi:hypothetical protein
VGLREQAEADLAFTLEDPAGFGWPITVTNPAGTAKSLVGSSGDIGRTIDPETGQAVAGREAHVTLRISTLEGLGLGIPSAVADKSSKPWRITFDDIGGTAHTFKVAAVMPDRMIGVVVCMLQVYQS